MTRFYAGIGSRVTPASVLEEMTVIASHLGKYGFTLRSGGAKGADTAFAKGAPVREIFWGTSDGKPMEIAQQFHPAWFKLNPPVQSLMARNVLILLGPKLDQPVEFVVCWTNGGKRTGGTGHALHIAASRHIPIYDLAVQDDRQRFMWLMEGL